MTLGSWGGSPEVMPAVIAGGTWTSVSLLKISSPLYFAFPCYRLKMSDLLEQDAYEAYSRGGGVPRELTGLQTVL